MIASHFYQPSTSTARETYSKLLSMIRKLADPACEESDILEITELVIEEILKPNEMESGPGKTSNNAASFLNKKRKAVMDIILGNVVLDLSQEVFISLFDMAKTLQKDFSANRGNIQAMYNGADGDDDEGKSLFSRIEQSSSSSSEDGDSDNSDKDSSSSDSDSDNNRETGDEDVKKILAERGANYSSSDDDMGDSGHGSGAIHLNINVLKGNPRFLVEQLGIFFPNRDPKVREDLAKKVLRVLGNRQNSSIYLKSQLDLAFHNEMKGFTEEEILGVGTFIRKTLIDNRWTIVYAKRLQDAANSPEEENRITEMLREHGRSSKEARDVYHSYTGLTIDTDELLADSNNRGDVDQGLFERRYRLKNTVNLKLIHRDNEKSTSESSLSTTVPKVPKGTMKQTFEFHHQLLLPACDTYNSSMKEERVRDVFPLWAQAGFDAKVDKLNPMQTVVRPSAFGTDENLLICAPTGAGKTNVALITILRVLDTYKTNPEGDSFRYNDFKIVYIAPMKALVQEVVQTFSRLLEPFNINVAELSGDSGLSRKQLGDTQMIVATPEKWDICTRKSVDLGVASLVRLIIIDEVHLLHNDRGPILESIVARTVLQEKRLRSKVRLVGLSATVPNHRDVAEFLKVDLHKGMFHFDSQYRPVPLQQSYCWIKSSTGGSSGGQRNKNDLNIVCFEKVKEFGGQSTMVFVHSRKDTEFTARFLVERAKQTGYELSRFVGGTPEGKDSIKEVMEQHADDLRDCLRELLPNGVGVHHAGMSKIERNIVERLFAEKQLRVLVSTSTLAWGVNLPAHAVIIKGTQIYSPEKGGTTPLSVLDVLQMFGRAGRKGLDTSGSACIITTMQDIDYYLRILNQQLPIESQFSNHIVDALNAEVALGTIKNLEDGVEWLKHTYFFTRMQKDPARYGLKISNNKKDNAASFEKAIIEYLQDLIHTAALTLANKNCAMANYDIDSGDISTTRIGGIASTFFIPHSSVEVYNSLLKPTMYDIDLFDVFCHSTEFKKITVRQDEGQDVKKLIDTCPIPVRNGRDYRQGINKVNVLLQAYISGRNLKDTSLATELVYIKASAQRIIKALCEISIAKDYGLTSRKLQEMYQMVLVQQWGVLSPIRQVLYHLEKMSHVTKSINIERARLEMAIESIERKDYFGLTYQNYRLYTEDRFVEHIFGGDEQLSRIFFKYLRVIPHLSATVTTNPISNTLLRIVIEVKVQCNYNPLIHDEVGSELILQLEDATVEQQESSYNFQDDSSSIIGRRRNILYHEVTDVSKLVKEDIAHDNLEDRQSITLMTVIPVPETSRPTHYFLHGVLGSWLGTAIKVPVPLLTLPFPAAPPAPTISMSNRDTSCGSEQEARQLFDSLDFCKSIFEFDQLRPIQATIIKSILINRDRLQPSSKWGNVFVGLPPGSGKTFLAELMGIRLLQENAAVANNTAVPSGIGESNGVLSVDRKKMLYLTCYPDQALRRFGEWNAKFNGILQQNVYLITGNTRQDLDALVSPNEEPMYIIACAQHFRHILQRANNKTDPRAIKALYSIRYVVADHLHLLSSGVAGGMYEAVLSRITSQKPYLMNDGVEPPRLLGLSYSVLYPQAFEKWLSIDKEYCFNFDPSERNLQVTVQGCNVLGAYNRAEFVRQLTESTLLIEQSKLVYPGAPLSKRGIENKGSTAVFVPTGVESTKMAIRYLTKLLAAQQRSPSIGKVMKASPEVKMAAALFRQENPSIEVNDGGEGDDSNGKRYTAAAAKAIPEDNEVARYIDSLSPRDALIEEMLYQLQDKRLRSLAFNGVAFLHPAMQAEDEQIILMAVENRYEPFTVFVSFDMCWRLPAAVFEVCIVSGAERIIPSAETSDSYSSPLGFKDCNLAEMTQMTTRARSQATVICRLPRTWMWTYLLSTNPSVPVESTLITASDYEEILMAKVASEATTDPQQQGTVMTMKGAMRVIMKHYFYHHLKINPSLYDISANPESPETFNSVLSEYCDAAIQGLVIAGCAVFAEEQGVTSPTSTGIAAVHHGISITTVTSLMEKAGEYNESVNSQHGSPFDTIKCCLSLVVSATEISSGSVLPASVVRVGEEEMLKQIAREISTDSINGAPPIIATEDLEFDSSASKAHILVAMLLSRGSFDLIEDIVVKNYQSKLDEEAVDVALTVADTLTMDAREIYEMTLRVTKAAVEITSKKCFAASSGLILLEQCLATMSIPSTCVRFHHLLQLPEEVLPTSVCKILSNNIIEKLNGDNCNNNGKSDQFTESWQFLTNAIGAISSQKVGPDINKPCSEISLLTQALRQYHSPSSLHALSTTDDGAVELDNSIADTAVQRALVLGRSLLSVHQYMMLSIGDTDNKKSASEQSRLKAVAVVQDVNGVLHLVINICLFPSSDTTVPASEGNNSTTDDDNLFNSYWLFCYNSANVLQPAFGVKAVRPIYMESVRNSGQMCYETEMVMPIPSMESEEEDIKPAVVMVPRRSIHLIDLSRMDGSSHASVVPCGIFAECEFEVEDDDNNNNE